MPPGGHRKPAPPDYRFEFLLFISLRLAKGRQLGTQAEAYATENRRSIN